jgi:hypothetical protein
VCLNDKARLVFAVDTPYPPLQRLHADPDCHPCGNVINVGERLEDGSMRLVRDRPAGTPAWKRIYHRARNAVEGSRAASEKWGLRRMPV